MRGMIIDGRTLAQELQQELKNQVSHETGQPHLTVITCAPDFATQKYLALKKKTAEAVGIAVNLVELPADVTTDDIVTTIAHAAIQTDGLIVQLPLPPHIDRAAVIAAIPQPVDVDGMHYAATGEGVLPPVVGAMEVIARRHGLVLQGQRVAVVGEGVLVGKPAVRWAKAHGAKVSVITEETPQPQHILAAADVVITGVGKPGLITPEQVRAGVVLFDAGTAEANGELRGDADVACSRVASLFTPVPGGIGPLTVIMLLENVLASYRQSAMMEPR